MNWRMDDDRTACRSERSNMQSLTLCTVAILLFHSLVGHTSLLSLAFALASVGLSTVFSWILVAAKQRTNARPNLVGSLMGGMVVFLLAVSLTFRAGFAEDSLSLFIWEAYTGCCLGVLSFCTQRLVEKRDETGSLGCTSRNPQESNITGASKHCCIAEASVLDEPQWHCRQYRTKHSLAQSVERMRKSLTTGEKSSHEQLGAHAEGEEDPLSFFRRFVSDDKAKQSKQGDFMKNAKKAKSRTRRRRRSDERQGISKSQSAMHPSKDNASGEVGCPASGVREPVHMGNAANTTGKSTSKPEERGNLRSVRFADDEGMEIETVFEIEPANYTGTKRVLVLLLLPKLYAYEFVALEYDTTMEDPERSIVRVSQILKELPSLASDPNMSKQEFVRLIRMDASRNDDESATGIELINALSIQSYNLNNDEILLAVPSETSKLQVLESSRQVVSNPKLMKAVSRVNECCVRVTQHHGYRHLANIFVFCLHLDLS
jgi:hypothetical protein